MCLNWGQQVSIVKSRQEISGYVKASTIDLQHQYSCILYSKILFSVFSFL